MKKLAFLFTFLIASVLPAYIQPEPCHWAIEGECLYWAPLFDSFSTIDEPIIGDPVALTLVASKFALDTIPFHSAFRAKAFYAFHSCSNLELEFTYFKGRANHTHSGFLREPFTFAAFFGDATSQIEYLYYNGEIILNHAMVPFGGMNVSLFEGIQGVWSNYHNGLVGGGIAFVSPGAFSLNNIFKSWSLGIGPEFGAHFDFSFFSSLKSVLSLVGQVKGALLVTRAKAYLSVIEFISGVNFGGGQSKTAARWLVVPAFDFKLGFDGKYFFRHGHIHFELGYEFLTYVDLQLLNHFANFDTAFRRSVSFHGPYASLGLSF